jgi:hypothetical protein
MRDHLIQGMKKFLWNQITFSNGLRHHVKSSQLTRVAQRERAHTHTTRLPNWIDKNRLASPNSSTAVKRRTTPPVPALSSIMCLCWAPIGHAPSAALNAGRLQRAGMPGFVDAFTGTPEYLPLRGVEIAMGDAWGVCSLGVPEMRSTYRIAREG